MASTFMCPCKILVLVITFSSLLLPRAASTVLIVGGEDGWVVPEKDEQTYNEWASQNRFKVNDTVKFKYKIDSVLVVTGEEYKNCHSSHPLFFSNNGDTVFTFNRPGLFYFISGIAGHCERGQRMIIKVLDLESLAPSGNDCGITEEQNKNAAPRIFAITSTAIVLLSQLPIALLFV